MKHALQMPNAAANDATRTSVTFARSLVIVGANGAGKSRLGAWLEAPLPGTPARAADGTPLLRVRRISAQRVVVLEDAVNRKGTADAQRSLAQGGDMPSPIGTSRTPGDAVVGTLNDYAALVQALFADNTAVALKYVQGARAGIAQGEPPTTALDQAVTTWQKIFSKRQLVVDEDAYRITAKPVGALGKEYPASQLSDGERAGLYLIGHALLTPREGVILVDEPEVHLHEAIQDFLWDTLEAARPDCGFVYLTHDLGFAAGRTDAPKIILREFTPVAVVPPAVALPGIVATTGHWDWDLVPALDVISEDEVLRIAGSRRPVLFVEGTQGGADHALYRRIYPDRFVVPVGGAEAVIRATSTFKATASLHRYAARGLIDRDDRTDDELKDLLKRGVGSLPVATLENLLVHELVLLAMDNKIAPSPGQAKAGSGNSNTSRPGQAKQAVITLFASLSDSIASERARAAARRRFSEIGKTGVGASETEADIEKTAKSVDASKLAAAAWAEVGSAVAAADYSRLLALARNKAVLEAAGKVFGLSSVNYGTEALRLIEDDDALRDELTKLLPVLPP